MKKGTKQILLVGGALTAAYFLFIKPAQAVGDAGAASFGAAAGATQGAITGTADVLGGLVREFIYLPYNIGVTAANALAGGAAQPPPRVAITPSTAARQMVGGSALTAKGVTTYYTTIGQGGSALNAIAAAQVAQAGRSFTPTSAAQLSNLGMISGVPASPVAVAAMAQNSAVLRGASGVPKTGNFFATNAAGQVIGSAAGYSSLAAARAAERVFR